MRAPIPCCADLGADRTDRRRRDVVCAAFLPTGFRLLLRNFMILRAGGCEACKIARKQPHPPARARANPATETRTSAQPLFV